jgi:PAS domain S-box-containing protein
MSEESVDDLNRQLSLAEARQKLLTETLTHAVWESDAAGVVEDSPAWRADTDQTLEGWLGYGRLEGIHPDDRAHAKRQWREAVAKRRAMDAEFRLRAPDGGWRWTNVRAAPVLDAEGGIEKWVGINIDINDRKRTEVALRESETKFRSVFETMIEACCVFDMIYDDQGRPADWRILEANAGYERQSGLRDVAGKLASEVMPGSEPYWLDTFGRVAETGVAEQIERWHQPTGRWVHSSTARIGGSDSRRLVSVFYDITERKRAEIELRESEERQAFLLNLSDALRPLADPEAIKLAAAEVLGRHLSASRVAYAEDAGDGESYVVSHNYIDAAPDLWGVFRYADFGSDILRNLTAGQNRVQPDIANDGRLSPAERQALANLGIGASLNVPLVKDGHLVGWLGVNWAAAHAITDEVIRLTQETAERTWAALERAHSEQALRESEERFRQFADASADALWIRDAKTYAFEYVSPAIEEIFGAKPAQVLEDAQLINALILPEERDVVSERIARISQGETITQEYRIRRASDGAFRWVRSTGFPLQDDAGQIGRIAAIASDISEARQLADHRAVLLAELQHRVRNIMGMIRSIANRSASGATEVEDYRSILEGRLLAISRVQALLTREANAGGSLREVIRSEISAQAHKDEQFELTGPEIRLSPKAVEVLTLAFHELTTNALKYGGLSGPDGRISVRWAPFAKRGEHWLRVDWVEDGAPPRPPSERRGFGSELIEARIPYELGGTGRVTIAPQGARCEIEFPLSNAESILETDAPAPTTVFGGSIDMTGAPDLTGQLVLVVEDDYYIASDTAAALSGAGAKVLGPYPRVEATKTALASASPTAAVVDLNLGGGGPQFEVARLLRERGVPFVFLTGYDPDVIPPELADVERLQKPVPLRAVVEALARLGR